MSGNRPIMPYQPVLLFLCPTLEGPDHHPIWGPVVFTYLLPPLTYWVFAFPDQRGALVEL